MKKTLYLVISFIIIIGLTGCNESSKTSNNQKDNSSNVQTDISSNSQTQTNIDIQKAKEIALSDAGLSENNVTDLSYEKDDDEDKYDISFKNAGKEYDYDISLSGDILNKSVENDD